MNLESLFVHPGPYPWLTLNNLIETNPRYLELFGPKFTNEEMNLFIRNWINGGNSNLQAVVMRLKLVDTEIIMNGIPAVWRETEEDLSYELGEDKTNEPDYFDYFFEIRNINGVVASIVADDGIDKFFFIYVWPDFKGQPYPLEPILQ
uniref:FBA_2 domain-containing protein n=1 Tax=Caenorhabditis tropicalis TaxID=1561998 RepID=A0A1I7UMK6_9PELO